MAPTVGEVIRCTLRQKYNSIHDHVNVLHYEIEDPPVPATDAALLADFSIGMADAWNLIEAGISDRLAAIDIALYNVTEDTPVGVITWGSAYSGGTSSGNGLPFDEAALIISYTGVKRTQGRIYVGGMIEANQNDGQLTTTFMTDLQFFSVALNNFVGTPFGGTYQRIVYDRSNALKHPITAENVQALLASQDRRRPGRGS